MVQVHHTPPTSFFKILFLVLLYALCTACCFLAPQAAAPGQRPRARLLRSGGRAGESLIGPGVVFFPPPPPRSRARPHKKHTIMILSSKKKQTATNTNHTPPYRRVVASLLFFKGRRRASLAPKGSNNVAVLLLVEIYFLRPELIARPVFSSRQA